MIQTTAFYLLQKMGKLTILCRYTVKNDCISESHSVITFFVLTKSRQQMVLILMIQHKATLVNVDSTL